MEWRGSWTFLGASSLITPFRLLPFATTGVTIRPSDYVVVTIITHDGHQRYPSCYHYCYPFCHSVMSYMLVTVFMRRRCVCFLMIIIVTITDIQCCPLCVITSVVYIFAVVSRSSFKDVNFHKALWHAAKQGRCTL